MDFRAKTIIIEGRGDTESGGASAGVKQPHGRFHRCRQPRTRRCRTPTLIDDLAVVDAAATEPKMTQPSMNALIRRLRDRERHGRIITFAKRKCLGGEIGRRARLRIWFRKECRFDPCPRYFFEFLRKPSQPFSGLGRCARLGFRLRSWVAAGRGLY